MRRASIPEIDGRGDLRCLLILVIGGAALILGGCGQKQKGVSAFAVPKVDACASGDSPETGLQGQVPAALRASGFKGYSCNLKNVGQLQGEGGNFSDAFFHDQSGHACAYVSTGSSKNIMTGEAITRLHPGVAVIDITDPARPRWVRSLTSPAMLDPWESLRVNPRRQVLAGDAGSNSVEGNSFVDFYDLSADCRDPQLLSSTSMSSGANGGMALPNAPVGHEGSFSPDGLTYYVGDIVNQTYNAVDITDITKPKVIAQFDTRHAPLHGAGYNGVSHGLSVSENGTRAYLVASGFPSVNDIHDPKYQNSDGFYVVDTTDVHQRRLNAKMALIASVRVPGGSEAQHTLPFRVAGKQYVVFVDEGGGVGSIDVPTAAAYSQFARASCDAGLAPFPTPTIYDMSDEAHPKLISSLALQTNDPANCSNVLPDIAGLTLFTYGSHYCSVDNRENATALACAYFNSGIRVFDIRKPASPKEIAYYNPAGAQTAQAGSIHVMAKQWQPGSPDWCTAQIEFDYSRHLLTTACQDNGLLVLEFENNVWPMKESTPSHEQH
jgi:hypothetical protein